MVKPGFLRGRGTLARVAMSLLGLVAPVLFVSTVTASHAWSVPAAASESLAPAFVPTVTTSCYNVSCKGLGPKATNCSADATTIDEFTSGYFRFELRFSHTCWAAWTRVSSSTTDGWRCNNSFAQIRGYQNATDGAASFLGSYSVQSPCPGSNVTKMWPYSNYVRACSSVARDVSPENCTNPH